MKEAQQIQRLKKKYKRITLTGLRIPAPPQHLNVIASLNSQQEQSIQKSSQSEDEQAYYQNYYDKQLRKIIDKMLEGLAEQIEWQIIDLKESQNEFQIEDDQPMEQIIDVVIKICIPDDRTKNLEQNIRNLKQKNEEKSQSQSQSSLKKVQKEKSKKNKNKNKNINKNMNKNKKVEEGNGKNQKGKLKNIEDQFGKASTESSGRNFYSSDNLELSNANIGDGKGDFQDSEDDEENNPNTEREQKKYKCKSQTKIMFGLYLYKKRILCLLFFMILSLIAAARGYSLYFVQKQTRFRKSIFIEPAASKVTYFGNIMEKYKKNKYFVPDSQKIAGQTLDAPLIVQYVPPVTKENESLHPRNISYYRPTQIIVYTYQQQEQNQKQEIQVKKEQSKQRRYIQFTQSQMQLATKLKELGNSDQQIMENLYIKLKNLTIESPLMTQLQYYYLSRKYEFLSQVSQEKELPLCILAYTQESLFQKNLFFPFFATLFAQNYSNFKLIYLQDGSPDPLNNQRILNYLWKNHNKEINRIGKDRFTFITLYSRINRPDAIGSIVRQFCSDDDIVVELDGQDKLLGKQALKLISGKYLENQNTWIGYSNGILQIKNFQQKQAYRLNENTTKKELNQQWEHSLVDMREELQKSYKSFSSLLFKQMENKPQFPETNYALKLCLKTYRVQLQQKLPYKYFNPSFKSYSTLNFANKIKNNFEYFLSMLQLSGRFITLKKGQQSHFVEIDEPLCGKNQENKKVRGCLLGMDEYYQVSRYTKDQFKPLNSLQDQQILLFENQIKIGDKFRAMNEGFEKQVQNICLQQMRSN